MQGNIIKMILCQFHGSPSLIFRHEHDQSLLTRASDRTQKKLKFHGFF